MKRSRINQIMAAADEMIRHYGFVLPPFAYWTPDEFRARRDVAGRVIGGRCGWDITDYGQGRFDEMGLFLFTLRNGLLSDLQRGGGIEYFAGCEPFQHHDLRNTATQPGRRYRELYRALREVLAGGAAADHASAEGAADEDGDDDADVPSATHRKA